MGENCAHGFYELNNDISRYLPILSQEIETSEPCNCIHFNNSHVIYGTGKFYTLDIKQHTVKGWLNFCFFFKVFLFVFAAWFCLTLILVSSSACSSFFGVLLALIHQLNKN